MSKEKEDYNPEKPKWDKRIPGDTPAMVRPVSSKDIRAARRAQKMASLSREAGQRANPEQKFYRDAEDAAEIARRGLQWAETEAPVIYKYEARFKYRRMLANALIDLGEFGEALGLVVMDNGNARPKFKDLMQLAIEIAAAITEDDDYCCGCRRESRLIERTDYKDQKVEGELPRRHFWRFVYSHKHGKVVSIWKCRHCGHANAHDKGAPANQLHIQAARQLSTNRPRAVAEHPTHLADHELFKK